MLQNTKVYLMPISKEVTHTNLKNTSLILFYLAASLIEAIRNVSSRFVSATSLLMDIVDLGLAPQHKVEGRHILSRIQKNSHKESTGKIVSL